MSDTTEHDDDSVLAAEYTLRLLDVDEERAAAARALTDRAFAADVTFWQERLAALADGVAEVAPSPAVEKALMQRLFPESARTSMLSLGFWKGLAAASTLAAAVLAFVAFSPEDLTGPPPLFVSEIASEDRSLRVLAVVNPVAHTVRITRTDGAAVSGRVLELWGIPADGTGPVSLGVLPDTEVAEVMVPEALFGKAVGLTLALSDEPPGGSPTGAPTGDVLAVGQLSEL